MYAARGAPAVPELRIRAGSTIAVIGRPGNGKTTLARWLIREKPSAIVVETKGDPREQREWIEAGFHPVEHPDRLDEHGRALMLVRSNWLLDHKRWSDSRHPWSMILEHPFKRRPTAVLFDEALNVFPAAGGHPGTHRLLQQGRSWGHVTMILSQVANSIDTRLLRLSQHIVVLGPVGALDVKHLTYATSTPPGRLMRLGKRCIAWWTEGAGNWQVYDPIDREGPPQLTPQSVYGGQALQAARGPRRWHRRPPPTPTVPVILEL